MSTASSVRAGLQTACAACAVIGLLWPAAVSAQDWTPRPITGLDGRFVLSGDATVTVGTADTGYFDYTDYDHSTLRLIRFDAIATLQATDRLSFLVELRAEGDSGGQGGWSGSPYAAYVRFKPWVQRPFEIQAGRIPPAFGSFPRRSYPTDNLLIGYPLAYQYLTALRSDSVPENADQLLAAAGRGWEIGYPVGDSAASNGVPIANVFRYDTGALLRAGTSQTRVEALASVTTGTLAYPELDHNGAPQVSGRVAVRPVIGLVLGASAASGDFVEGSVRDVLPAAVRQRRYPQRTWGADAEYSRDYWLVRTEWVGTAWHLPAIAAPYIDQPLGANAWLLEGRYKIVPGLYAAARYDRLWFSRVDGSAGRLPWDAGVSRVEAGIGYNLARSVLIKAVVQDNHRDRGRTLHSTLAALQAVLWF